MKLQYLLFNNIFFFSIIFTFFNKNVSFSITYFLLFNVMQNTFSFQFQYYSLLFNVNYIFFPQYFLSSGVLSLKNCINTIFLSVVFASFTKRFLFRFSKKDFFKGILHQKIFYRLNLIFWIVMGCGIADFDRRGL